MLSNDEIGKKIKRLRKEQGLTQSELAAKIGKKLRTVQKYENGEIDMPLSVICEIAIALGTTGVELLEMVDNSSKKSAPTNEEKFVFSLEKGFKMNIHIRKSAISDSFECSVTVKKT